MLVALGDVRFPSVGLGDRSGSIERNCLEGVLLKAGREKKGENCGNLQFIGRPCLSERVTLHNSFYTHPMKLSQLQYCLLHLSDESQLRV